MKKDNGWSRTGWWKRCFPICCLTLVLHTSCQNEEAVGDEPRLAELEIITEVDASDSRGGVITGNTLPNGTQIGVLLVDAGGEGYQDLVYDNVCYTAVEGDDGQEWHTDKAVMLSGESATLYAYHPWKPDTDIESISIDLTRSQDDWLYATPFVGLDNANPEAYLEMHHALSNMRINLVKGDFIGTGKVSRIALTSQGIALKATLNGKTGALTGVQQMGVQLSNTVDGQIGDSPVTVDVLFVPTKVVDTPIKVDVTVDNRVYTITSPPVTTQEGTLIDFTLIQNSVMLEFGGFTVTPWHPALDETLEAEKKK